MSSIPDDLFEKAERLAERLDMNRSQLFSEAVAEYVSRRDPETVTQRLDVVLDGLGEGAGQDPIVRDVQDPPSSASGGAIPL